MTYFELGKKDSARAEYEILKGLDEKKAQELLEKIEEKSLEF